MIILTDTFNKKVLSKHRSVFTAIRALSKHAKEAKRCNSDGYSITDKHGVDIKDILKQIESII